MGKRKKRQRVQNPKPMDKGWQKAFRERALEQGAYDGRFGHKVEKSKKREIERKKCRKKVELEND